MFLPRTKFSGDGEVCLPARGKRVVCSSVKEKGGICFPAAEMKGFAFQSEGRMWCALQPRGKEESVFLQQRWRGLPCSRREEMGVSSSHREGMSQFSFQQGWIGEL